MAFALLGCNQQGKNTGQNPQLGQLSYDIIELSSPEFEKLCTGEFNNWYSKNYKIKGAYSFSQGNYTYLLVCAGEKPTGGYFLKDLVLLGKEKEISVKVKLRVPAKDEFVTQALSYPHLLAKITQDSRKPVLERIEEIEKTEVSNSEIHIDSGKYLGRIDNNSIEVRISGVPEEISPRAFQLSTKVKESFEELGLKPGDEILFKFTYSENSQPVVIEMRKLK